VTDGQAERRTLCPHDIPYFAKNALKRNHVPVDERAPLLVANKAALVLQKH
jgi:hypothetical protein